jgi:hypothetical protein
MLFCQYLIQATVPLAVASYEADSIFSEVAWSCVFDVCVCVRFAELESSAGDAGALDGQLLEEALACVASPDSEELSMDALQLVQPFLSLLFYF